jgi:hypothetical protein
MDLASFGGFRCQRMIRGANGPDTSPIEPPASAEPRRGLAPLTMTPDRAARIIEALEGPSRDLAPIRIHHEGVASRPPAHRDLPHHRRPCGAITSYNPATRGPCEHRGARLDPPFGEGRGEAFTLQDVRDAEAAALEEWAMGPTPRPRLPFRDLGTRRAPDASPGALDDPNRMSAPTA